jgi:YfiH family protein
MEALERPGTRVVTAGALRWLEPDWPVTRRVRVISTLRHGGVSLDRYASLNLAEHVGDDAAAVAENRRRVRVAGALPAEPCWLQQVHGTRVVEALSSRRSLPEADAAWTRAPGRVCAIGTADCMPIVLADEQGTCVAIAHAGWRGLAGGVLEATIQALGLPGAVLCAWLGPAISEPAFEVGAEVRDAFVARDAAAGRFFTKNARGRFQADLDGLARLALARLGVGRVYGGGWCTSSNARDFYSYRRDGRTGRMATLAWLA